MLVFVVPPSSLPAMFIMHMARLIVLAVLIMDVPGFLVFVVPVSAQHHGAFAGLVAPVKD